MTEYAYPQSKQAGSVAVNEGGWAPAPWTVRPFPNGGKDREIVDANGRKVVFASGHLRDDCLANGNLIAAAPMLYEALIEARHVVEDYALDYERPAKLVREVFAKDLLAMIDNAINLAAGKDIED